MGYYDIIELLKGGKISLNKLNGDTYNRQEVIEFARENEIFSLATSQDSNPRVRGMSLFLADNSGLYFCTGKPKDVYKQLKVNSKVEMYFYSENQMTQLRLRGTIEELDNVELKQKAIEKFPFLKPIAQQHGYDPFAIFCFSKGESATWTMQSETSGEYVPFVPF